MSCVNFNQFGLYDASNPKHSLFMKAVLCIANVLMTPFCMIFHSIRIYVIPCVGQYCFQCLCLACPAGCGKFTDSEFPPNHKSLGTIESRGHEVEWVRIQDLVQSNESGKRAVLFDDRIDATDVCQGALGDCWLLAAFATLCERPAFIQNCFITRSFTPTGKYSIRLFDKKKGKFVRIVIDDYIPCYESGGRKRPLFSHFNGYEMWPLLLEKAFAKLRGSYAAIEGGWALDGMMTCTGYEGVSYLGGNLNDELFRKLKKYLAHGCLAAAASGGKDKTRIEGRSKVKSSIVGGHAYSILAVASPHLTTKSIKLLKLRNPWGSFEWDGDWSDNSPLWDEHPGVAFEIGKPEKGAPEDGVFYMCWEDFLKHFKMIDVLFPNYGMDNLHYRIYEEDRLCGNCLGCYLGCTSYWCLCKGFCTLWCQKSSHQMRHELESHNGGQNSNFFSIV